MNSRRIVPCFVTFICGIALGYSGSLIFPGRELVIVDETGYRLHEPEHWHTRRTMDGGGEGIIIYDHGYTPNTEDQIAVSKYGPLVPADFTGVYIELHTNGNISERQLFRAGKRHGTLTAWHGRGQKASEYFEDGTGGSLFLHWREDGTLDEIQRYKNGKMVYKE